ncbi:MAG TPA: DUF423 domain-containing protein [Cyclobacteriaceae bacterium]|nr:DUF423 domain-containing protein [Cyclobacteriaceae bacterium]
MNNKQLLLTGAVLGLVSVILGAFGAHAFKGILTANNRVDTYELAVRYQFIHAIALLFAGLWVGQETWIGGYAWLAGVLLFSGSLYVMSFTNSTALYVVLATPLGGLMYILGWLSLIVAIVRR